MTESPRHAYVQETPLSDRMNPVFVRELQQALKGRVFGVSLYLSLLAIIGLGIYFAGLSSNPVSDEPRGRDAFQAVLMILAPILIVIVPAQALHSTVKEVQGGAAELLFLSRITPFGLIRGKLFAALGQSLLYLSLFAPTLALTFLLRGVDVKMIGSHLVLAALASVVCTSFAVAAGTLARFRPITALVTGATILALFWALFIAWAFIAIGMRAFFSPSLPWFVTTSVVGIVSTLAVTLFAVCGCAMLKHPYENRSSAIRVYAVVMMGAVFALNAVVLATAPREEMLRFSSLSATAIAAIFFLFASTEDDLLSPRVRTQVPKNPLLALLVTPFLPGRGRGLLFTVLCVAALASVIAVTQALHPVPVLTGPGTVVSSSRRFDEFGRYALAMQGYCLAFCGIAALIRGFMRPGTAKNWQARLLWFSAIVVAMIVPFVIQVLTSSRAIGNSSWTKAHIFNPAWTLDDGLDSGSEARSTLTLLFGIAAIFLLLNAPVILRSVREVLDASRERRRSEAEAATLPQVAKTA